ncbi:aminodeoxychorismate synthase component I [Roseibium sp.]|uniref:aminodeoxychorismate synthase component I n=1 Tax=Roseibium sp. TaxID=1936156 RepID=UPI003A9872EF
MTSISQQQGSVLLLDCLDEKRALYFQSPVRTISCRNLADVRHCLRAVDAAQAEGMHVAGYMAYELGYAFEEKLQGPFGSNEDLLAWFGVYQAPASMDLDEAREMLADGAGEAPAVLNDVAFDWSADQYDDAFRQVQEHLAKGDIYQVNLTMRAKFRHQGTPEAIFLELIKRQPVAYAALVKLDDRSIVSLSPELFLERKGRRLRTKPMKGTAPRGRTPDEDRAVARELARDPKQRAENTMIVDLMRNDLSRIAETGSVKVHSLCEVERYKSLHQMTSTIEADLLPDTGFAKIVENLFPCGSITGAPKLSAMMIADRLETSPRGVYTGSIGHLAPGGDFRFNVAIRTLVLNDDGTGVAGTGSGVVHDSGATPEYDECRLKLKFMSAPEEAYDLFETMAYHPEDGYLLLARHVQRLKTSAAYFGIAFDEDRLQDMLKQRARAYLVPMRVRVLLSQGGDLSMSETVLPDAGGQQRWTVGIADERTHSANRFLFHKTTNRTFYDDARKRYGKATGCNEVLFRNENGFLTEGSFTNLFVRTHGRLLTPGLHHGLLPGTLRAGMLERGLAQEADLMPEDLANADAVFVGNSVRGLIDVTVLNFRS